jgi:hypothetical protein
LALAPQHEVSTGARDREDPHESPAARADAMWRTFPALVWRQGRSEAPLSEPLARTFRGTVLEREERAPWLDGSGLSFYIEHAPGRDELHLERASPAYQKRWRAWYETRDDRLLVREPCLSDPATRAALSAQLERSIAARGGDFGIGLSLGDEVSQTPASGPEDICLCAHCRAAWRSFLERERARGATDVAADFDPAIASTDATRLALADGRTEALQPWLLRRHFQQEVLLGLLSSLAGESRRRAPGVAVGLLGLTGQSAFGGVAIERVLPELGFAECYRTGVARELLFALRGEATRALQTVFPEPELWHGSAWQVFEAWMRGADGLVVWSDREFARRPAYLERLARAVGDVRAIERELPAFAPRPQGVAIVHSADAIALGWLRDALLDGATWPRRFQGYQESHGSLETSQRAWLRLLEDCGAQPGALPLDDLGAATAQRFPLLVANHLAVLDEGDLARLERFLAAGGSLVVSGPFGEVDPRGRRAENSALERLRETGPGRVHEFASFSAAYLEIRCNGGAALRDEARALLAKARVALAPWRIRCDDPALPWLCTWSVGADGVWSCASLPNLAEKEERSAARSTPGEGHRLSDLAVEIVPPPQYAVRWIHPREGETSGAHRLPAGDAAVFELAPTASDAKR